MSRQNPVRMVVHLTTPAADVPVVIQIRRTATVILARVDILLPAQTDTAVQLIKNVPAELPAAPNAINVNRLPNLLKKNMNGGFIQMKVHLLVG